MENMENDSYSEQERELRMKPTVGVMGSATDAEEGPGGEAVRETASALGRALAAHEVVLMTGATTGIVYLVGKAAKASGVFHVGSLTGDLWPRACRTLSTPPGRLRFDRLHRLWFEGPECSAGAFVRDCDLYRGSNGIS